MTSLFAILPFGFAAKPATLAIFALTYVLALANSFGVSLLIAGSVSNIIVVQQTRARRQNFLSHLRAARRSGHPGDPGRIARLGSLDGVAAILQRNWLPALTLPSPPRRGNHPWPRLESQYAMNLIMRATSSPSPGGEGRVEGGRASFLTRPSSPKANPNGKGGYSPCPGEPKGCFLSLIFSR